MECDRSKCTYGNFDLAWEVAENERLRHDIERHIAITTQQQADIELLKVRLENAEDDTARLSAKWIAETRENERLRAALKEARQAINDYGLDDFEETTHETLAMIDKALAVEQSKD